jgi:hypothetical protein
MNRYLIEVPHEEEAVACARAVKILLETGSHFLSHADWGCLDGVHKGWVTVEAETKEQARQMLPASYRYSAVIVQLNKFTIEEVDEIIRYHKVKS